MYKKKSFYKKKHSKKPHNLKALVRNEIKFALSKEIEVKQFSANVFNLQPAFGGANALAAIGHTDNQATTDVLISVGGGSANRIGDVIHIKRINLKGYVVMGDTFNNCRMIVFRYYNLTGNSATSTPLITQVLNIFDNNLGVNLTTAESPMATQNLDSKHSGLIHIMYDRTFTGIGAIQGDSSIQQINHIITGKRLGKPRIVYPETAAAVGCASNGIYVYFLSDSLAVPHPTMLLNVALDFADA